MKRSDLDKFILRLIALYKRYISPHKGYRCAYSALHGGDSRSTEIAKIIRSHGTYRGLHLVHRQMINCSNAYEVLASKKRKNNHKQKGKDKKKKDKENLACELPCHAINCFSGVRVFFKVISVLHRRA